MTESIGWALVHFIWQGALIGAATAAALVGLRGASANVRYLVACGGLVSMLAAPVITVQRMYAAPSPTDVAFVAAASATASEPVAASPRPLPLSGVVATTPERGLGAFLPVAVYAWIAGVLLLSLRLAGGWLTIAALRRRRTADVGRDVQQRISQLSARLQLSRPVRVMESTLVSVPTLVGWLRPVILLPASVVAGLPPAHLDAVLAHELAHVRRHDFLVNALQAVVETLLFYHPAVWWCSRQARIEREHCCDDLAVAACGDKVMYATALATLEDLRRTDMHLALAATGGSLIERVRRVLGVAPAHDGRAGVFAAAVGVALLLMLAVGSRTLGRADAAAPHLLEDVAAGAPETDVTGPHLKEGGLLTFAWDFFGGWDAPRPPHAPRAPRPPRPPHVPGFMLLQAPRTLTPPTPPSAPTPPTAPTAPTGRPMRDSEMSMWTWSDHNARVTLRHRGAITLNDDDTDIIGIAPGGYFNLIETSNWVPRILSEWIGVRREIVIRGNPDGTMTRAYYGRERQAPFEPRGRDWLRAVMPDLARRGFGAEARVARILKTEGAVGLAAEIPRLRGDYLRALYVREALRQGPLAPRDLAALLAGAQGIGSDYEQAQTLVAVARTYKLDNDTAPAFFRAVNTIQSDYEQRRALQAAAASVSTPAAVDELFRSAARLHSDYEQAEFLRAAAARQLPAQAPEAFFSAVSTIQSDYEQRRVLSEMLDRQLDPATAQAMMASAVRLGSDYEQAEFLIAAARKGVDEKAQAPFFDAVDSIGSDFEQRRVLSTLAARPALSEATLSAMLERARLLQNDHERAEFLIAVARRHPIAGAARDQYMRATDQMRNDHEQSRALLALMRTERGTR